MAPLFATAMATPLFTWIPVAPLTPVKVIEPLFTTALEVSIVTAGPATVGVIEPAVSMVRWSGWPPAMVEVFTGAVVAVEILVSA